MNLSRLISWCLAVCFVGLIGFAHAAEPFRLLTIGNSFAEDALYYFPKLAAAAGKDVSVYRANLGGHSLEQHASYLSAYTKDPADPKGRPYPPLSGEGQKAGLPEALKSQRWDAVTIQQYSRLSPNAATYEPFASQLLAEIKQDAPQAKVFVYQTWAYREDSPLFINGYTQPKMYELIQVAYKTLADKHKLPIIPVGTAFQNARGTAEWKFTFPDPSFNYETPPQGSLPKQEGSLNAGWKWVKDKQGNLKFTLDANHANDAGRYLAACVFYEVLFGESVLENTFVPSSLSSEQAAHLRKIAHDTVASASR